MQLVIEPEHKLIYLARVEQRDDVHVLNHYQEQVGGFSIDGGRKWKGRLWLRLWIFDAKKTVEILNEYKYEYVLETPEIMDFETVKHCPSLLPAKNDIYCNLPSSVHGCNSYRTKKIWEMEPLKLSTMRELIDSPFFGCQYTEYKNNMQRDRHLRPYNNDNHPANVKRACFSREDHGMGYCDMGIRIPIGVLPDDISTFCSLKYLYLSAHVLTDLPESLSELRQLEILHLDDNQFKHFPDVLRRMPRLRELNMDLNPIPKSMPGLRPLTQLDRLYIHHSSLGPDIRYMKELRSLQVGQDIPERQRDTTFEWFEHATDEDVHEAVLKIPCEVVLAPKLRYIEVGYIEGFTPEQLNDEWMQVRWQLRRWLAGLVIMQALKKNVRQRKAIRAEYECVIHEYNMRLRDLANKK